MTTTDANILDVTLVEKMGSNGHVDGDGVSEESPGLTLGEVTPETFHFDKELEVYLKKFWSFTKPKDFTIMKII